MKIRLISGGLVSVGLWIIMNEYYRTSELDKIIEGTFESVNWKFSVNQTEIPRL